MPDTMPDAMLTLQQVMEATGFSYSHIRGLIASGQLVGYRVPGGRAVRVKARDVDALFIPVLPTKQGA
jgi:excisionase family DNA binding protein